MKKSYILLIGLISAILALILIPLFFYYASFLGYFFLDLLNSYFDFLTQYFGYFSSHFILILTFIIIVSIFLVTLGCISDQYDNEKRKLAESQDSRESHK